MSSARGTGDLLSVQSHAPTLAAGFDFYGVRVRFETDDGEVLSRVKKDFWYFAADPPPPASTRLEIVARRKVPDYSSLPALRATIYTPRNICYTSGDITYIDYFGKALGVFDRSTRRLEIASKNIHVLHEVVYLAMLSQVGAQLERLGMHRMHALAFGRGEECAVFMMPSGCGKTTLGMEILRHSDSLQLVSDDSPLISRNGRVSPFPLRWGVLSDPRPTIDDEHVYYVERMEFAPKYLISLAAYESSVARGSFRPRFIFVGDRSLGKGCEIRRVGFIVGFRACVRHMIVGVGLYQGLEFLLQNSILDLTRSSGIFVSRALAAVSVLRRAQVYSVTLGRNPKHNAEVITEFLHRQLGRPC